MSVVTGVDSSAVEGPPDASPGSRVLLFLAKFGTLLAMAAMLILFAAMVPNGAFFRTSNLLAILNQSALTAIIASGLTLVAVVNQMDLSIGYAASLAGVVSTGLMVRSGLPILVAILIVLALGAAIGLVNGLLVTKAGVNSVVATLGVGTMLIGLAFGYTAGSVITSVPATFKQLTLGRTLGVQNPIWIMAIVLVILWLLLNRTALGQSMQAVGSNASAARLAGIRVDRVTIAGFVVSGLCAALTGTLLASLLGSGTVSAADGYLLDSFAAVFLGAATLRDGEFHIVGTLLGVLIVNIGFNGLSLMGTPTFWQYLFKGGILVLAVAMSSVARRHGRT